MEDALQVDAMSGDVWTIIGVGVAILCIGGIVYRELRSDIRGLQDDVSNLREVSGPGPPVRIDRNRSGIRPCFPFPAGEEYASTDSNPASVRFSPD